MVLCGEMLGLIWWKIVRQKRPFASRFIYVQYGIDKLTLTMPHNIRSHKFTIDDGGFFGFCLLSASSGRIDDSVNTPPIMHFYP